MMGSMALQLAPEEPEAGPWRVELLSTVVNAVTRRRPDRGREVAHLIDTVIWVQADEREAGRRAAAGCRLAASRAWLGSGG